MHIKPITNFRGNNSKYFESFFLQQVRCWGEEPFSEFMVCSQCETQFSISDMGLCGDDIGSQLNISESCPCCNNALEFIYFNQGFKNEIQDYFSFKVTCILLLGDDEEVEGFCVIVQKSIEELLDYEFGLRGGYNTEDTLSTFSGRGISLSEELLCLHHIYISESARGKNYAGKLMNHGLTLASAGRDSPVVMETHKESLFVPLSNKLGFRPVGEEDRFGYQIYIAREVREIISYNRDTYE